MSGREDLPMYDEAHQFWTVATCDDLQLPTRSNWVDV
jgi:hypothetical protein